MSLKKHLERRVYSLRKGFPERVDPSFKAFRRQENRTGSHKTLPLQTFRNKHRSVQDSLQTPYEHRRPLQNFCHILPCFIIHKFNLRLIHIRTEYVRIRLCYSAI